MTAIVDADKRQTDSARASDRALAPVWIAGAIAVAGLVFAWSWTSGTNASQARSGPLPIIAGPIPDFSLTNEDGKSIKRSDLEGQIWVADFVFTQCGGPCPKLSERMRAVQYALVDYPPDVKLVSLSLDPETDTPPVLRRYAQRFNADSHRWMFLTSDSEATMHRLIGKGFLQTVVPASDDTPLTHSNYFVLIDGQGRIRAVHDGMKAETKNAILRDIDTLLAERTAP